MKKTLIDFLSGISRTRELDLPIHTTAMILASILSYYFGLGFWGWVIADIIIGAMITLTIALVDTFHMYKLRIRQEAVKSIEAMVGMKKRRW